MQVDTSDYGLTPAQYHAGLDKLWAAMPQYTGPTSEGVFTLAVQEIEGLKLALKSANAVRDEAIADIKSLQAENARLLELLVEVRSAIKDQTCCGVSYCDLVITDDLANRIDAATKGERE